MDYTIAFDAPAEKIYQDFTSRHYWDTLMDAYGCLTPQSEITHFTSDESGTDIAFRQNLPRACTCRRSARAVMPVDMVITREQHFDPFDHADNRATGTYRASSRTGRVTSAADTSSPRPTRGSELRLVSVCKVHIPLIGGTLEQLILSHIKLLFDAEEAFTADWIAKHH